MATRAVGPASVDRAERGCREGQEQPWVFSHRLWHPLAPDEASRDQDPGVGLVEVGAGGTDDGASVLTGDHEGTLVDFPGVRVDEFAA